MNGFAFIDPAPAVQIHEGEYGRLLGYPPGRRLEGRARELSLQARVWYAAHGRPWLCAWELERLRLTVDDLEIAGRTLHSSRLRNLWLRAEVNAGVLVAASAGVECEQQAGELWRAGKSDEYFFLQTLGAAAVERLIADAGARICAWAEGRGMAALAHYSPGYTGWRIEDQHPLFELASDRAPGGFPGPLELLASGMLAPAKSQLALVGITPRIDLARAIPDLIPCEACAFPACRYRRAPYRHDAWNPDPQVRNPSPAMVTPVGPWPYSFREKTLRKWAGEHLRLTTSPAGETTAVFRYHGTTCSNLGRPLEFQYVVRLGPREEGRKVMGLACAPAPGDEGHRSMCGYLRAGERLLAEVAAEKPLLGRPLAEALSWKRASQPAGCYCDRSSRDHKWGLVFEVIHFALSQPSAAWPACGPIQTI